jgi:hypothetical protein
MKFTVLALVILFVAHSPNAKASPPGLTPVFRSPMLFVDPSATKVSFGKASLVVNPLAHRGKYYVGNYLLKVIPYFFMSEKGTLKLDASDGVVQSLMEGNVVEFTGNATNNKNGKPKIINGKAIPSTNNRGSVTFSVQTDNGPMIFNTSYHFGE